MKNIGIVLLIFICFSANARELEDNFDIVSIPKLDWGIKISSKGYEIQRNGYNSEIDQRMIHIMNNDNMVNLSVFIEPGVPNKGLDVYKEMFLERLSKSPLKPSSSEYAAHPSGSVLKQLVKEYEGQELNLRSRNLLMIKDGYWIDVHISLINSDEKDDIMLDNMVNEIVIVDNSEPHLMEQFMLGSSAFYQRRYKDAIAPLEVLSKELGKDEEKDKIWFVANDNLGMAYALSGDIEKSLDHFNRLIEIESEYPMFHYNLACGYAESSNREKMLEHLKLALDYKENMLEGERFPDAANDNSFSKYINDEEFKELIEN